MIFETWSREAVLATVEAATRKPDEFASKAIWSGKPAMVRKYKITSLAPGYMGEVIFAAIMDETDPNLWLVTYSPFFIN